MPETLARALRDNLYYAQGRIPEFASPHDWYAALAYTVRDRLLHRWIQTVQTFLQQDTRVVSYLSAEFLMGPHLGNALVNLGIAEEARRAAAQLGLDLDELLRQEEEPGLGNGGLGRLAACFLDSLATLEVPAVGYGIRYEFGMFDQVIRDGWQVEVTDKWLRYGNPWELARPEIAYNISLEGHTEPYHDEAGRFRVRWVPGRVVKGVAYDTPVLGYRANTANLLRLWKAEATESFDVEAFNVGDYFGAVDEKVSSETITKVLYPNDEPSQGKQLRLAQQFFFVSCSLQDMIRVTNGVTPRRWIVLSNLRLAALISGKIGDSWVSRMESELPRLAEWCDDPEFQQQWRQVKRGCKADFSSLIRERTGIAVDPDTLFDIQVKRLHEYKRQHLNLLHIVTLYNRIKKNPGADITPRTFIFGGKAAPGYAMAKLIIKLITEVAEVVNRDPDVGARLKVVFFPDFNVKNSQPIYPAADLSEQISTAGKEASGTGNMKFAMNGALTIGTLDGANVEIREEVGAENFFLFGHTVEEVMELKARGYHPRGFYDSNGELREAVDRIASGHFSRGDGNLFKPLVDSLLNRDEYLLLADYGSYVDCQDRVGQVFRDQQHWTRMSILNTSRSGKFSSDRSIRDYCERIWKVKPGPVPPG
jgi:glucan phosphorylase